ncbi:hypothetical protein SAMN04488511_101526 [Pedobacter suwonensis]|uniref:Uncharacterized protein n=2 Tax=Pedobacter suwonensis TaxID=332999 RepID=A0A1I0SJY9_9SPHI|nr:hypothetical protein SAMN04488511_101526 [Pedobacter suwonensis]
MFATAARKTRKNLIYSVISVFLWLIHFCTFYKSNIPIIYLFYFFFGLVYPYLCGEMLNRFVAISLLFALIGSNFSRFFIYAGFEVNQKYITEKLCENRNRPWMHCNGKCFLMKKLKQAEEKEKKQERENQRSHYMEALPAAAWSFTFKRSTVKMIYPERSVPGTMHRAFSIFQPPKALSLQA